MSVWSSTAESVVLHDWNSKKVYHVPAEERSSCAAIIGGGWGIIVMTAPIVTHKADTAEHVTLQSSPRKEAISVDASFAERVAEHMDGESSSQLLSDSCLSSMRRPRGRPSRHQPW